jgi:hypothetical protein
MNTVQGSMAVCSRSECQNTGGCAHRGPLGELCYFPNYTAPPRGCICPPGSEATCKGWACPRQPFMTLQQQ